MHNPKNHTAMLTKSEPQVKPSERYSTKETVQILGITRETLRQYVMRGKIKCGIRKANGRKFYLGSEILRMWKATY